MIMKYLYLNITIKLSYNNGKVFKYLTSKNHNDM